MNKRIKTILGHCCPRCGGTLTWETVDRLLGPEDGAPEIVACQHCDTLLKVKGNRIARFVKICVVLYVPALIFASVWAPWAGLAVIILLIPFIARIIGIEEAL